MSNLDRIEELRDAKQELGAMLSRIRSQAEREEREYTPSEKATLEGKAARVRALEQQIGAANTDRALTAQIERITSGMMTETRGMRGLSIGAQFINSPAGDWLRHTKNRGKHWETPIAEIDVPALFATTITEGGTGGITPPPTYLPGIIPTPIPRPSVARLLGVGQTTSNSVAYLTETSFTNAAAAVAEGAAKPESALSFKQVNEPVVKIACWIPASEEALDDLPALGDYINQRLGLGVELTEEDQILNGDGNAPNMLGLLKRPGLGADVVRTDPMTNADAIGEAIFQLESTTGLPVSGTILNPANWRTIALSKDSMGRYLDGGGPFAAPTPPVLWGRPAVISPRMPINTALVVSAASAMVYRRSGLTLGMSNSHQDFYVKNLVAIRAEIREALCVFIPSAICRVTALN